MYVCMLSVWHSVGNRGGALGRVENDLKGPPLVRGSVLAVKWGHSLSMTLTFQSRSHKDEGREGPWALTLPFSR